MFRFSIRDVLWMTLVVGLALALLVERSNHRETFRTAYKLNRMLDYLATQVTWGHDAWIIKTTDNGIEITMPEANTVMGDNWSDVPLSW